MHGGTGIVMAEKKSLPTACYAAFLSNDFTNPPTCDYTSIWLSFNASTSAGTSRSGGR
jgi:hypothetical protein